MMNLDELFEILDCYIEESNWLEPRIWYSDNTITKPLRTNGIEFNKNNITCSTTSINKEYDGIANSITGNIDRQLTANH